MVLLWHLMYALIANVNLIGRQSWLEDLYYLPAVDICGGIGNIYLLA